MTINTITFNPISSATPSADGGSAVTFDVTNNSNELVLLYWVDRTGTPQLYNGVDPNGAIVQPTYTTHTWELASKDGKVSFAFNPTIAGNITIGADYKPTFTDFSEHVTQTVNGLWSTTQGYGLINVAKSLGVPDLGANLSINTQSNNIALDAISASSAWAAGYTGKGVTVAVLDVGIASNPEINKQVVGEHDFADPNGNGQPAAGAYQDHPLGVASIIAASHDAHTGPDTMGVAPDASILNVRVGDPTGSSSSNIAAGITWAVDHGANVICMPLENQSTNNDPAIAAAVHYAYQHNVVTVIIGGNYSNYGPTGPAELAGTGEAIAVGNYNVYAGTAFGSSNMAGAVPMPWVMASSSGYVPNAAGGYTFYSDGGTSFAGPYVAGLAALLKQQNPNATAADIIQKIEAGASLSTASLASVSGQILTGTDGNDVLVSTSGNDMINGGKGTDTVVYHGNMADYSVAATATGFTVTDNAGHDGTDMLSNVERLQFNDGNIALDVNGSGVGGEVYRLYQAAFNRAPDLPGLGFWMSAMDAGKPLIDVANGFMHSDEAIKLYGASPSNQDLITAMYHNVLHREPEAAGLQFWMDNMARGTTAAQLLIAFSDSAENIGNEIKIIGNGFHYTPFHS